MEEITSIEPEVEDNLQLPSKSEIVLPSTPKTPRSRKSYKGLLIFSMLIDNWSLSDFKVKAFSKKYIMVLYW